MIFKKQLIVFTSALIFLISASAFSYDEKKLYISFNPGLGISFPNGNALYGTQFSNYKTNGSSSTLWHDPQYGYSLGYNIGLKAIYTASNSFFLQLGVAYDVKTLKVVYPKYNSTQDYTYEYLAKFLNLSGGARVFLTDRFSLGAGGFYGFIMTNIEQTEQYSYSGSNVTKTTLIDKDLIHDNYGAYLEASLIVYNKNNSNLKHIEAGLRFEKGFSKVFQNNTPGVSYIYTNTLLGFIDLVFGF